MRLVDVGGGDRACGVNGVLYPVCSCNSLAGQPIDIQNSQLMQHAEHEQAKSLDMEVNGNLTGGVSKFIGS